MPDIRIKFKDQDYLIPDSRAFEVGMAVEEIITLGRLGKLLEDPKFHVIAKCFGVMLRFAGAKVSDRDVLAEMMAKVKGNEAGAGRLAAVEALMMIGAVLMDGAPDTAKGEDSGKISAL